MIVGLRRSWYSSGAYFWWPGRLAMRLHLVRDVGVGQAVAVERGHAAVIHLRARATDGGEVVGLAVRAEPLADRRAIGGVPAQKTRRVDAAICADLLRLLRHRDRVRSVREEEQAP